jgi:hypothetical protein
MRPVIHAVQCTSCATLAFLFASGCSHVPASTDHTEEPAVGPPSAVVSLLEDTDTPLDIHLLREHSNGTLLIVESRQAVFWQLDASGERPPRRWVKVGSGQVPIVSFAVAGDRVAAVLADGEAIILRHSTGTIETRIPGGGIARRPLAVEAIRNSIYVLSEVVESDTMTGDRITSLQIDRIDGDALVPLWRRDKHRLSELATRTTAWNSLSTDGEQLLLATSAPATIEVVPITSRDSGSMALDGVPQRPLTDADAKTQRKALNSLPEPYRSQVRPLEQYPPLMKFWPVPGGHAVVATSADNAFALDLYCNGRFLATRLTGSHIRNLWQWRTGVAALVASADDQYRLEFYDAPALQLRCP